VVVVSLASTVTIIARHSTGTPLWANGLRAPGYSWFETRNRLGWRDITVTAALEGIIRERKQHRPVRILTGQMGMVPYHLTQRFGTRVQWIDRYGLSDRAFTDCPLTTGRFGGRSGMRISYAFYLSKRDRFKTECGIVEPDLIFDLGDEDRAVVETFGYQLLYRRAGMIESGTWPSGSPVNGNAWVAMKPPTDVGR
jgi:hypothetical protein